MLNFEEVIGLLTKSLRLLEIRSPLVCDRSWNFFSLLLFYFPKHYSWFVLIHAYSAVLLGIMSFASDMATFPALTTTPMEMLISMQPQVIESARQCPTGRAHQLPRLLIGTDLYLIMSLLFPKLKEVALYGVQGYSHRGPD